MHFLSHSITLYMFATFVVYIYVVGEKTNKYTKSTKRVTIVVQKTLSWHTDNIEAVLKAFTISRGIISTYHSFVLTTVYIGYMCKSLMAEYVLLHNYGCL